MKLKEFKESIYFKLADIVEYYDQEGKEVTYTTEIGRRWLLNRPVIELSKRKEGNLRILRITLGMEVER